MAIHVGKKIKEELYRQNFPISTFAKKINRSRNVVYDIFGRESIDTDLLNTIGRVLNVDFFSMYSSQKEYVQENVKHFYVSESAMSYGKSADQMVALQQQIESLTTEVEYLKKIISLLEQKKELKPKKK
ncbi:MAG: hypothetical protein V4549_10120 [Bacteroidota bacterium]